MKNFKASLLLLIIFQAIIKAQTVDDIVSKALAAKGGAEKIKAVQTQRLSGQILFGSGAGNPFVVTLERPGKIKEEITMNGMNIVEINNGKEGWSINPMSGNKSAVSMTEDELKNTSSSADLDGPLVDYKERGNKIDFLGMEKINGKPAYKLLINQKNGQVRYDYIDSVTYLELKWAGSVLSNGSENPVESFFINYKDVDGLMFPYEIDSDSPGGGNKQRIIFDKIEINPKLDGSTFNEPVAAPSDSTKH